MTKKYKITLLVSTYNWVDALRLCLLSASSQTILPDEIVIADDGSRSDTRTLIDSLRSVVNVPITHVWQEDDGFRLSTIRNKAIAKSKGDYIIQIDGDIIMERHFIQDHIAIMQKGFFVAGSRVCIGNNDTNKMLNVQDFKFNRLLQRKYLLSPNGLRSKVLRNFLATRYAKRIDHMRGCNLAYWKDDIITVNGYNEDFKGWGYEDGELAFRLHYSGVKKKALKMGGVVYHLWHKLSSRDSEDTHIKALHFAKKNQIKWCVNGINKYLRK